MSGSGRSSFKKAPRPVRGFAPNFARSHHRRDGYSVTEFGATFYAFCICIVFPTICFVNFGVAFTYGFIASSVAADKASQAMNFERAEKVLFDSNEKLCCDNVAHLIKIEPGAKPFQLDLVRSNSKGEIRVITYGTAAFGAGSASRAGSASDSATAILQYRIIANYSVKPLIDAGMVPLINSLPIIGKPTAISFQHLRTPEHDEFWTD